MKLNFKTIIVCVVILTISFFVYQKIGNKKGDNKSSVCKNISGKQAIDIVKGFPEVKEYLKSGYKTSESQTSTAAISVDKENKSSWTIHVYSTEVYAKKLDIPSHLATFNWYSINKCTGKILCEFAIYDSKGKFIKVGNNYPCE